MKEKKWFKCAGSIPSVLDSKPRGRKIVYFGEKSVFNSSHITAVTS